MDKGRLEAFSDGVIAIIITIMVLEMRAPTEPDFSALRPILPAFLAYALSFIHVGIYWNNHHHLFRAVQHVGDHEHDTLAVLDTVAPAAAVIATVMVTVHTWPAPMPGTVQVSVGDAKLQLPPRFCVVAGAAIWIG